MGQHLGSSSGAGHGVANPQLCPHVFPCSSSASTPCLPSAGPTDTLRHHLPLVSRFWGHEGLPALGWMEAGVGRFICYRKMWLHGLTGEEGALSRGFEVQEQWGAVPVASKPRCCLFFFHSCRQPAAAESLVTSALSPSGRGLQCLVPPSKRAALAAFQLTQVGKLRPRLYSIQRLLWHMFSSRFSFFPSCSVSWAGGDHVRELWGHLSTACLMLPHLPPGRSHRARLKTLTGGGCNWCSASHQGAPI